MPLFPGLGHFLRLDAGRILHVLYYGICNFSSGWGFFDAICLKPYFSCAEVCEICHFPIDCERKKNQQVVSAEFKRLAQKTSFNMQSTKIPSPKIAFG